MGQRSQPHQLRRQKNGGARYPRPTQQKSATFARPTPHTSRTGGQPSQHVGRESPVLGLVEQVVVEAGVEFQGLST